MRGVKTNLLVMAFVALPLALGAWAVQKKIADNARAEVGRLLTTVRDTTHLALKNWFKDQTSAALVWANTAEIRELALQLRELPLTSDALLKSPAQQSLRNWFQRLQNATNYHGYFIVGPNHINLASSRDQNVGVINLLVRQQGFLADVWAGKPAISLPIHSEIPLVNSQGQLVDGLPSMFVAAPIPDDAGEIIAIFMFRLNPEEGFTNTLKQGRIGNTGETFAFNNTGRLISQSRYDDQLHKIGLIKAGEHGILNIELRDPGINLLEGKRPDLPRNQHPLTQMAKRAIQGETGVNLAGYRDYRGVPVVGAWVWENELGFGISTELDVQEAYQSLSVSQLAITTISLFAFFLLTSLTVIYTLFHQRKTAENLAQSEQDKAQLYFDTVETIIVALDTQGNISRLNRKGCELLGYTEQELIGLNWFSVCLPENQQENVQSVFKAIIDGSMEGVDYHENTVVTRSGEHRLIAWHNTFIKDSSGHITGSLSTGEDITEKKQVEDELRRAATVFDNTDEGIIVTNAEADIILVNNAFTDITGFMPEEVLGENPRFQKSGRHDKAFYETMWDALARNGQWRGEIWNQRKNGEIYPAWENINVVRDSQGLITNYVAIFSDISAFKESEERLAHLAHHDTLTGLPNRLRFMANLEQALESAKRRQRKVALMFLDLDKFKYINDTLGHNSGDELLKIIAERLKACVRAEDTVARLGGDEFTIVLTEIAQAEDAGLIAEKIVKAIHKPVTVSGETMETSASVGISIYPDDATEYEDMVKAADTAMYHAKMMGRNGFQFYTADLTKRTFEHARIEKDLPGALENEEFELYYQPQINMVDGRIAGLEALVRWNHPTYGQLLPEKFIYVADDSDLIDALSEWVLRTALSDYKKWSENGSTGPRIAVNITSRQITNKQSIQHILDVLDELAPEPDMLQLDLEITEAALAGTEQTINLFNMLSRRGIMFAIDDFGTGHAPLGRLKQIPIDTIKIDRPYVRNIADQDDDKAIAAAIIAMAHSLKLRVIAEGVETRSQLDLLRTLECDEIQGFIFCKPIPASEVEQLMEKSFH